MLSLGTFRANLNNLTDLALATLANLFRAKARQTAKSGARDLYATGVRALKADRAAEGLAILLQVDELETRWDAKTNIGYALMQLDRHEEAIPYLVRAAQLNPNSENAWINLSAAYQTLDKVDEHLSALERYVAVTKNESKKKQMREVIRLTRKAIKERVEDTSTEDYFCSATETGKQIWSTTQPVYVYIDKGTTTFDYKPEFAVVVQQAFTAWQAALNDTIRFKYVEEKEAAQIDVRWTKNGLETELGGESGSCKWDHKAGAIVAAHIFIALTGNSKPRAVLSTALHEVGHALGIRGHSNDNQDIMYICGAPRKRSVPKLSERDIATIRRLYATTDDESWLSLMNRAIDFEKRKRFSLAAECYEKAMASTDNPAVRNNFAVMHAAWAKDLASGEDAKAAEEHFVAATQLLRGMSNEIYADILGAYAKFLFAQHRDVEARALEASRATMLRG